MAVLSTASYWFTARPETAANSAPFLVFDGQGNLHFPLTLYAKSSTHRLAKSSVRKYLFGLLPWFTWLDADPWHNGCHALHSLGSSGSSGSSGQRWNVEPNLVRALVREYLVYRLRCRVKPHEAGFEFIEATEAVMTQVRAFLSSLKLFYTVMIQHGFYRHSHPLAASLSVGVHDAITAYAPAPESATPGREGRLRMPDVSGVDAPLFPLTAPRRLTSNFFKVINDDWVPQVITDPTLPQLILSAGERWGQQVAQTTDPGHPVSPVSGWHLREICLVLLLFETGARVSEVCGLTLGDWAERGLETTVWSRNKGSIKRQAKYLRFSPETALLLRRYFDEERTQIDPGGYTVEQYLRLAQRQAVDLHQIPLFLSGRGTPWRPASFREHYWKPALRVGGLRAMIHQTRHWYVTQAMAIIHERARLGELTVEQGIAELVAYMHWREGATVIAAYNHFYDPVRHAETQAWLYARLHASLLDQPNPSSQPALVSVSSTPVRPEPMLDPIEANVPGFEAPHHSEFPGDLLPDTTAVYAFLVGNERQQ